MKNLGKFLLLLILSSSSLFAALESYVDSTQVTRSEMVTFTIKASGRAINQPSIAKLCGEKVVSKSSSTNITSINGNFEKVYTLSYGFVPTKSCTIDPISVEVDGKAEMTKPINIKVTKAIRDVNADFQLEIQSEKKNLYVGEPFKVVLTFKQRSTNHAVDSNFTPAGMESFWIKAEKQGQAYQKDGFNITTITYILAPQRAGEQTITPAVMKIASRSNSRDAWGQWMSGVKWKNYFSNELKFNVKALPEGVTLVGDFTLDVQVDKRTVDANEPVNLLLTLKGKGNFEDIDTLKPHITNASIFDEDPKVEFTINQDDYRATLQQKMAIIAGDDYTIAPIVIKYFDTKSQTVKVIKSEPIEIKVNANTMIEKNDKVKIEKAEPNDTPVVVQKQIVQKSSPLQLVLALIIGIIIGAVGILIPWKKIFIKEQQEKSINLKDYKTLLIQLIAHKENPEVLPIISALEAHLYEGKSLDIDKKVLKDIRNRLRKNLL